MKCLEELAADAADQQRERSSNNKNMHLMSLAEGEEHQQEEEGDCMPSCCVLRSLNEALISLLNDCIYVRQRIVSLSASFSLH